MPREPERREQEPRGHEQRGQQGRKVNLNKASRDELLMLETIGPEVADRIIQYRQEHGGFKEIREVEQLFQGSKIRMDKIRNQVTI